ncbi:MAG TPA: ISLre2 family transposase [Bacilli bacterium]|nr:ISLre2 family transposase [Bacilli bacterium]
MEKIISDIYQIIKQTDNLIDLEEDIKTYMHQLFSGLIGDVFTRIDRGMKEKKRSEGWTVVHSDDKTVNFTFGAVTFSHTSMKDKRGTSHHPFDEWLGLDKYQRYSPLVEVKVAEMATEMDYRETARVLNEWTAVEMSHGTVGNIVKRVGSAQAAADQQMVEELDIADHLPVGKKVDYLFAEADGVFVKSTQKGKGIEVSQAIIYEGWNLNGKRVSLKEPTVIMTPKPISIFWDEVQAITAHKYSLEQTKIATNSDGGKGYTADKFQTVFSQSENKVLNQLDTYHITQAITRTFGAQSSELKDKVRQAIKCHDRGQFKLWVDTYESTLAESDEKKIDQLKKFKNYIQNNWTRIFDWRQKVEKIPDGARSLGAMESNQRRISFRMKRRGMCWSQSGSLGMVKVIQGRTNRTLRDAYLNRYKLSDRKKREIKQSIRMSHFLAQPTRPSIGVKQGSVSLYVAHSTAVGNLLKSMR